MTKIEKIRIKYWKLNDQKKKIENNMLKEVEKLLNEMEGPRKHDEVLTRAYWNEKKSDLKKVINQ